MIDPTLYSLGTALVEKLIAEALLCDPGTKAQLGRLIGKCMSIEIDDMKLNVVVHFTDDTPRVSAQALDDGAQMDADLTLRGHVSALVSLMRADTYSLADSGVTAEGQVGLLEQLHHIMQNLDIDWQDALNQKLDSPFVTPMLNLVSEPFTLGLKKIRQEISASINGSVNQFSDYAQYESGLVVSQNEFDVFSQSINTLRQRTDRLQAQLDALKAKQASS